MEQTAGSDPGEPGNSGGTQTAAPQVDRAVLKETLLEILNEVPAFRRNRAPPDPSQNPGASGSTDARQPGQDATGNAGAVGQQQHVQRQGKHQGGCFSGVGR